MRKIILFLAVLFIFKDSYADSFILTINYTEGEKSKDSHSSTTLIKLTGNEVTFAKSYSGYGARESESKNCVFSDEQIFEIQKLIKDNKLNVTDSLFQKTNKYKSFEIFVNLTISLAMEENVSKVCVNGDAKQLDDVPLYKNSLKLIRLIQRYLDKC